MIHPAWFWNNPSKRDLLVLSVVTMIVVILVEVFGLFNAFQEWIRMQPQWTEWRVHDYLFILVILVFVLAVFSRRRWIELRREVAERKQVEEALRQSEERFRSVVQSSTDAIVLTDEAGKIISWNKGAEVMFGYAQEEILGRPLTVLMPERYREPHRKRFGQYWSAGESNIIGKTLEFHGLRKNGSEFPLEISVATWRTADGIFYSGIVRDITERKELVRELQDALANVKTLRGLIPMCASCKKIRNDKGYWQQVEAYLMEHSDARFSHGVCPDCGEKLYGELWPQRKG